MGVLIIVIIFFWPSALKIALSSFPQKFGERLRKSQYCHSHLTVHKYYELSKYIRWDMITQTCQENFISSSLVEPWPLANSPLASSLVQHPHWLLLTFSLLSFPFSLNQPSVHREDKSISVLKLEKHGFKSWFWSLLVGWSWAMQLGSLSLSLLIYKMGTLIGLIVSPPPKKTPQICWLRLYPLIQHVTLYGNRVVKDVINWDDVLLELARALIQFD